jgi:hypothetical protein
MNCGSRPLASAGGIGARKGYIECIVASSDSYPHPHPHLHSHQTLLSLFQPSISSRSFFLTTKTSLLAIMVYFSKIAGAVAAACLASSVVAHPGEHHDAAHMKREIKARNQMASAAKRSIDTCSGSLKARQLNARSAARRAEVARDIRAKRNIQTSKISY